MDISVNNSLTDSLSALRQARSARAYAFQPAATQKPEENLPTRVPANIDAPSGTRLINESREQVGDTGYRLTRTFEREDGRTFTKVEEFALTQRGARRTVVQQNPSGSITRYEEVLDRETGGNFRRTQRFQDGNGDVATNITGDYKVTDPFILTGGNAPTAHNPALFDPARGTQLDLRA